MRYIKIPGPVSITVVVQTKDGKTEQKTVDYTLDNWLAQEVWPHVYWRTDEATWAAYIRIHAAFCGDQGKHPVKSGVVVSLEDDDYERFKPLATKRGERLPDGITHELMQLLHPVMFASKDDPSKEPSKKELGRAAKAKGQAN